MEKPTHYIEITAMSLDGEAPSQADHGFVFSKAMAAVHRHVENGHEVAVSFPQMNSDIKAIGGKMRVFGDVAALAAFLAEPMFAALVASACCVVGRQPIREVPMEVEWIKVNRDRIAEKSCAGFLARAARRRDRRGTQESRLPPPARTSSAPFVTLQSQSSGGRFTMSLKVTPMAEFTPGAVSSYGLSVPVPSF